AVKNGEPKPAPPKKLEPDPPKLPPKEDPAVPLLERGRRALQEARYHDALTALEDAGKLRPQDDQIGKLLQQARAGLEKTKRLQEVNAVLAKGRAHLNAGRFEQAIAILTPIAKEAPETDTLLAEARKGARNKRLTDSILAYEERRGVAEKASAEE